MGLVMASQAFLGKVVFSKTLWGNFVGDFAESFGLSIAIHIELLVAMKAIEIAYSNSWWSF